MEAEGLIIIEQLGQIVQKNTAQIVEYYTTWHLLSALGWAFIGGFLMIAALKAPTPEGFEKPFPIIVRSVAFLLGMLMVTTNMPDIFAPEAYAIHQLIIDIRGR